MFTTTGRVEAPVVTERKNGALGLDLNADYIAVSRIDASGNPTEAWSIATLLFGKSKHQIEAMLGDAVASAVRYAKVDKKKSGRSKKTNRKVSMMAYSAFRQVLSSRAFSEGVEVIGINPAYTSVIGLASCLRMLERVRKDQRSGSRQASNSARGVPLSTAAGPSPDMDGSPGSRGNPSGGSQQHCSAGVCECISILEPF